MPRRKIHNLISISFLLWFATQINAQCVNQASAPCKLYEKAAAVFIGTVKEISYSEPYEEGTSISKKNLRKKITLFEIKESFKGIPEKQNEFVVAALQLQKKSPTGELKFEKHFYEGCVSYEFAENETYLVFADRSSVNKDFLVDPAQALPVDEASIAITYLRNLKTGKPLAMLSGRVTRKVRPLGTFFEETIERPIRNIKVEIQNEKEKFTLTTDEKGDYLFSEIPSGEYFIKYDLPDRVPAENNSKKISLSTKSCNEENIIVPTTGQISGIVFNHKGRASSDISVELMPVNQAANSRTNVFVARSDRASGRFEFNAIPAGQYYLGFSLTSSYSGCMPGYFRDSQFCLRSYYPGVSDISLATLITLGEGEKLENYDLNLSLPLTERTISGIVLWPDGRTIVNAVIVIAELKPAAQWNWHYFGQLDSVTNTDAYGRFSLKAFSELNFWINANIKIKGEDKHSEPIDLPLNGDMNEIKLVVSSSGKFCSLCYSKYWKRKGAPNQ